MANVYTCQTLGTSAAFEDTRKGIVTMNWIFPGEREEKIEGESERETVYAAH